MTIVASPSSPPAARRIGEGSRPAIAVALPAAPAMETPGRASGWAMLLGAASLLALTFAWPAPAAAAEPAARSALIETSTVYAPRGFTELCARRPEICAAERAAADIDPAAEALASMFGRDAAGFRAPRLTHGRVQQLRQVNATVNASIRPTEDRGADLWELNAARGDCEEYVLMKRELLARLGWPRSALRITVVRDSVGYHAVLVVETDQGGFVLDNMTQRITTVQDSPYEFVVAQSIDTPGAWTRVHLR
ncbi:MAG: transglutaminase-like cysteine peptidase, partial [Pseudomonadota bacterium]